MGNDFKSQFNSEFNKNNTDINKKNQAFEAYKKTASREYPRLCNELMKLTKDIFAGVSGVEINETKIELELTWYEDNKLKSLARITVPTWVVSFDKKSVVFKPEGSVIGACGKISVETDGINPLFKEAIFLVHSKDNDDEWVLATLDKSHTAFRLTQTKLEDFFKATLLAKRNSES